MRRCGLQLALLVALLLACDAPWVRTFDAEFPLVVLDPEFDIAMHAVPVTLKDATGLVASLEILGREGLQRPGPGIEVDPARPRTAIVRWDGGSCLERVRMALSRDAIQGFTLDVEEQLPMLFGGCAGVGISRGVIITFTEEISADQFVLSVEPT